MLNLGIILDLKLPFVSPIVIVKKDGTKRVCVD